MFENQKKEKYEIKDIFTPISI